MLLGFDEDGSGIQKIARRQQDIHLFDAGKLFENRRIEQIASDMDGLFERLHLILLNVDAAAVVLHLVRTVDHFREGIQDSALVIVSRLQLPGIRATLQGTNLDVLTRVNLGNVRLSANHFLADRAGDND